jgi:DNA-nicking Smr family endonuclease
MKKNKPPDKPQTYFKNKPFASLKGRVPSTDVRAIKNTAPPVRKKIHASNEDDVTLFLRATEGAKRFNHAPDEHDVSVNERQCPKKAVVRGLDETRLFLAAMQKIGTTFRDPLPERELEESERRSPTSRRRQLKRGTICIGQELDLHGFLKDEALMRLEQFVAAACSGGQQAVLVITGKGINSPEGPVLQGAVAEWLRKKGKGLVAEFSPAPRELGGSGAFVVFLKKQCS